MNLEVEWYVDFYLGVFHSPGSILTRNFFPVLFINQRESSRANRQTLIAESTERKLTAKEAARREKQIKLAETLRLKADAEERGEDTERNKNWEWTIEENDEWERKKKRKKRNADFEFHGMHGFATFMYIFSDPYTLLQTKSNVHTDGTRKTLCT